MESKSKKRQLKSKTVQLSKKIRKIEQKKITDLPNEILERILRTFDINQLLKVALTNKRLLAVVRDLYNLKYASTDIKIGTFVGVKKSETTELYIVRRTTRKLVEHIDQKNIRLFVWVFRDSIPRIDVSFIAIRTQKQRQIFGKFFIAISKYATSLEVMELDHFSKENLRSFSNSLPQVKVVLFRECDLGGNDRFITNIFPNIQWLGIHPRDRCQNGLIEHEIKTLKDTTLVIVSKVNISEFKLFFRMNPQITRVTLHIAHSCAWNLIQFIADYSQIETLHLISDLEPPMETFQFNTKLRMFRYTTDTNKQFFQPGDGSWLIVSEKKDLKNLSIRDLYNKRQLNINETE